jgi:hypothetical protein
MEWDVVVIPSLTVEKVEESDFSIDLLEQNKNISSKFEVIIIDEFFVNNKQTEFSIDSLLEKLTQTPSKFDVDSLVITTLNIP